MQIEPNDHALPGVYHEEHISNDFPVKLQYHYVMDDAPVSSLQYHDVLEIGYCHDGNGVFMVDRKILPYHKGDVSVIAPNEMHIARSLNGTKSLWSFVFVDINDFVYTRFPELGAFDISVFSGQSFQNIIDNSGSPEFVGYVRTIVRELRMRPPFFKSAVVSLLSQVAIQLMRRGAPEQSDINARVSRHGMNRIRAALEHVVLNYRRPILLEELADRCNMSVRNFTRLFRNEMGQSAVKYIERTRIAFACEQLLRSRDLIATIAEENGFGSPSSFNRIFKAQMGVAPREWRARYGR
jgi:AraC family transcriptional regulator, activator of mtrCDE